MFRINSSPFFVPAGEYLGRYQGTRKLPQTNYKGRNGKIMPPGIAHKWEIVDGPYKGKVVERVVTAKITENNTHGEVLKGLAQNDDYEDFRDLLADDYVGNLYRLNVEEYEKDNESKERGCRVDGIEPAEEEYPQDLYPKDLYTEAEKSKATTKPKNATRKGVKTKAYYVKVNGIRTGPFDEAGVQRTIMTCLKRGDLIGAVSGG